MITKYFNENEFKNALSHMESNPKKAKEYFEDYLKKHTKDYSAYICYIAILITLGEFKEAEKQLDILEFNVEADKQYLNSAPKENQDKLKFNIISTRLRLLSYQERYEEVYQIRLNNYQLLKKYGLDTTKLTFYCKKKLGMLDPNRRGQKVYDFRQIVRYEENDFLKYNQMYLAEYNTYLEDENVTMFVANFPLEEIVNEVKKHIPTAPKLYPYLYVDVYIFKYDKCGRHKNKTVDYFKVICFHNTNDIVRIYPSADCEELPSIDLNYLTKNDTNQSKCPVKRLSQIDKFNKRYGIK